MVPFDQAGGMGALGAPLGWIEGVLLGPVAVAVATIAVALFGMMMLAGRLHYRAGARIVLGCFILFGARSIATGLLSASSELAGGGTAYAAPAAMAPPVLPPPLARPARPAPPIDPYAGASAPTAAGSCCD